MVATGGTANGDSLQLGGMGTTYEDFTWNAPAPASAGSCNPGQTFVSLGTALVINEIDYDQPSTDWAEFVEIKNTGGAATNLDAFTLTLVNGTEIS